jgi:hypothetical protein
MLRVLHKYGFATLLGIAAGLMVSLSAPPAPATELLTDEKILDALKAKRLTRCPVMSTRPRCGGARLHNLLPKGRLSMSKSLRAAPPFSRRERSFRAIPLRQRSIHLFARSE